MNKESEDDSLTKRIRERLANKSNATAKVHGMIKSTFNQLLESNRKVVASEPQEDEPTKEEGPSAINSVLLKLLIASNQTETPTPKKELNLSTEMLMKEAFAGLLKENKIDDFNPAQNFKQIQKTHSNENRFTDNVFKACNESVYYSDSFKRSLTGNRIISADGNIKWVRAKDLANDAQFVMHGESNAASQITEHNYTKFFHTTDLDQGALGNCWFIAGATGIIQNFDLFRKVVPFENSFDDAKYTGAFHFRFWIYGTWKDVVVDDYLPVGVNNRLIFSKNREVKNEFWCALLEKAYAKVYGSYEALESGQTTDALVDMSGGIEEAYNLSEIRNRVSHTDKSDQVDAKTFWSILINARKKRSVIGCNIELPKRSSVAEIKLSNGLVQGHAYVLTKVAEIEINGVDCRLLRVYNPWGDLEWNGDFSENCPIWNYVDQEIQDQIGVRKEQDGEFWMRYEDWLDNFDNCQICNLTPSILPDMSESDWRNQKKLSNIFSMWQPHLFHGEWVKGVSAGGRGQTDRVKFWTNPQFRFVINEAEINENKCLVLIALMQKYTRQKRVALGVASAEEYIQYRLFKTKTQVAEDDEEPVDASNLEKIGTSGPYINKREVSQRFSLSPGTYVIIPSCYDDDVQGEFLLRVFTEKPLAQRSFNQSKRERKLNKETSVDKVDATGLSSAFLSNFAQLTTDFAKITCHVVDKDWVKVEATKPEHTDKKKPLSCNQM